MAQCDLYSEFLRSGKIKWISIEESKLIHLYTGDSGEKNIMFLWDLQKYGDLPAVVTD